MTKIPSWPKLLAELKYHGITPDGNGKYSIDDMRYFEAYSTDSDFQHISRDAAINSLRADGLLRP